MNIPAVTPFRSIVMKNEKKSKVIPSVLAIEVFLCTNLSIVPLFKTAFLEEFNNKKKLTKLMNRIVVFIMCYL
ncbi:hypothetical protein OAT18_03660 [Tenacibaculum sp.]|nr:hypothetical protein [Tenacibaculum sp.]